MDKMLVCGTSAPGSIPGGSTTVNKISLTLVSGKFYLASQLLGLRAVVLAGAMSPARS